MLGPGSSSSFYSHINNEGSSSHVHDDDENPENGDKNDENQNEGNSDNKEEEEGIPVPSKEERERIDLILRDLPSDSGRTTPSSSKENITLRECLKNFVKVEVLEGDNSFACDNCWKLKEQYNEQKKMEKMMDSADTSDNSDNIDNEDDTGINADNDDDAVAAAAAAAGGGGGGGGDGGGSGGGGAAAAGDVSNNDTVDNINDVKANDVGDSSDVGDSNDVGNIDNANNVGDSNNVDSIDNADNVDNTSNGNADDVNIDSDGTPIGAENGETGDIGNGEQSSSEANDQMEDVVFNNAEAAGRVSPQTSNSTGVDETENENPITTGDGDDNGDKNLSFDSTFNHNSYMSIDSSEPEPIPESTPEPKSESNSESKYILRKAYKRYLFDSLPPVMVFHLKRFQQVGGKWSVSMRKIDDFVAFDEELDVGDFVVPPEIEKKTEGNGVNNGHIDKEIHRSKQHTKYRLYGVVVHLGSLYNGHYIAYVLSSNLRGRGQQMGVPSLSTENMRRVREIELQNRKMGLQRQWIYCSDSCVRAASIDDVLRSGAYLLFYERVHE